MAFFKVIDSGLLYATNFVEGPNIHLRKEDKDTYSFPVDGWDWIDYSLDFDIKSDTIKIRKLVDYLYSANVLDKVNNFMHQYEVSATNLIPLIDWKYGMQVSTDSELIKALNTLLGLDLSTVSELY